ncbi:hypothetical protein PT277_04625 [Acetobacteraceae bacterium ESL0709]|nr:hypothetical protein [Acetobacteraceae bacterium ESL0697]MDF7677980.1 hypothetical protein [Acetobacteraceae bacterium ESL0709]
MQNDGSDDFNGASIQSLQDEINRAQNAETQLVSGTFGATLEDGDIQGLGLFYQGSTGNTCFVYKDKSGTLQYVNLASFPYIAKCN